MAKLAALFVCPAKDVSLHREELESLPLLLLSFLLSPTDPLMDSAYLAFGK